MTKAPVQIILNSDSYVQNEIPKTIKVQGKDFFANDNNGFIQKKRDLIYGLEILQKEKEKSSIKTLYAKVSMRHDALAKSYRPTNKLFCSKNSCEVVGGLNMGEMLIKLYNGATESLIQGIRNNAEEKVKYGIVRNERVAKPSIWRCEVSAIDKISLFDSHDKIPIPIEELTTYLTEQKTGFYIELFETPVNRANYDMLNKEDYLLFKQLMDVIESFNGIRLFRSKIANMPKLLSGYITINKDNKVNLTSAISSKIDLDSLSNNKEAISKILFYLSQCTIVKKIVPMLNPQGFYGPSFDVNGTKSYTLPRPLPDVDYPLLGLIDTGISDIFKEWIIDEDDSVPTKYLDKEHGTNIAGLLIAGKDLNNPMGKQLFCQEKDGCKIFNLGILPNKNNINKIYPSSDDLISALETAVSNAAEQGVRIFNLSININSIRLYSDYSPFAHALDYLSDKYDVVFIISAGNLKNNRTPWKPDPSQWFSNINSIKSKKGIDIAYAPAESLRNLSVAALNASDLGLASYSRIGKGSSLAIKPDLAQVGGDAEDLGELQSGLYSLNKLAKIISVRGTSFSAPLVAKTMACLDKDIEGYVSRETLIALIVHSGYIPVPFSAKQYGLQVKDLIGYGKPKTSGDILNCTDNSITMVFASRIKSKKIFSFNFSWPKSLVDDKGKIRGHVKLTIVSKPRLNLDYGEEQVRDNLTAFLRQINEEGKAKGILHPLYKSSEKSVNDDYLQEWALIEDNQKWNPIKVSEKTFKAIGGGTNFAIQIEYLSRDIIKDTEGIPFTAILTISDPKGEAPVYNEMRRSLITSNVQIADIQTATRSTLRV